MAAADSPRDLARALDHHRPGRAGPRSRRMRQRAGQSICGQSCATRCADISPPISSVSPTACSPTRPPLPSRADRIGPTAGSIVRFWSGAAGTAIRWRSGRSPLGLRVRPGVFCPPGLTRKSWGSYEVKGSATSRTAGRRGPLVLHLGEEMTDRRLAGDRAVTRGVNRAVSACGRRAVHWRPGGVPGADNQLWS